MEMYTETPLFIKLAPVWQFPSFALYVVFVIVLIKNCKKTLNSSFFHLVISLGVNDIIYCIISTIWPTFIHRDAGSPMVRQAVTLGGYWLYSGAPCSQLNGVVLLGLNRFTALVFPTKHKELWSGRWQMPTAICIHWSPVLVTGAALASPLFKLRKIHKNESYQTETGYDLHPSTNVFWWLGLQAFELLVAITIIVMYAVMVAKMFLYRLNKNVTSTQERNEWVREVKLALIGFILGVFVICLAFIHIVIGGYAVGIGSEWFARFLIFVGWPLVGSFFTLSNPYLILACSTPARKCFLEYIGCKK